MLKSLLGRNPFVGIIHEDPLQKVEELAVELGVAWYYLLQLMLALL